MSRWAPDAALRLEQAAMELFALQGYAATSVPQIAQRAGLTTRTFFRHFADKREVLFLRERELPKVVASLVAEAPDGLPPVALVMHGFEVLAAGPFEKWRPAMLTRRAVVRSDPALRERELLKNVALAGVIADALAADGVNARDASLAARHAVLIFEVALDRWLDSSDEGPLVPILKATQERLMLLATGADQRG